MHETSQQEADRLLAEFQLARMVRASDAKNPLRTETETMTTPAPFYILGKPEHGFCWVLNLDGYPSKERCERAIAWQRIGQGEFDPADYWQICTWDAQKVCFVTLDGEALEVSEGPYTEAAWQEFTRKLPGVVEA